MSLSSKDPAEKVVITFDFTVLGQPILNPVITVTDNSTGQSMPEMLSGNAQVASGKVLQMITGGSSGKKYTLKCQIDTSTSTERFVLKDILVVA